MISWPKMYRTPPPLDDVLLIAHFQLLANPTISSYFMNEKGQEVRKSVGNPFARMTDSFKRLGEAAVIVSEQFREFLAAGEAKLSKIEWENYHGV